MTQDIPQCNALKDQVNALLHLLQQEPSLRAQLNTTAVEASCDKATSPKFEIVFAGAFSAGKSMLINALLGRELLYSAQGHATGTECYIQYPSSQQGREDVVLTFLSEAEIRTQANSLAESLQLPSPVQITQPEIRTKLQTECQKIIDEAGGETKTEFAKRANALSLLLQGYSENSNYIQSVTNKVCSMEDFNFSDLTEAASYARRGSNSSVLKRIEYQCYHPLLEDGNIIVDTPGIDAPVERDRLLTYDKIAHADTSAVICVLKAASAGELSREETQLLETVRNNSGIGDRVFYVFNRIDETWYDDELLSLLNRLITSQFQDSRIYETSALLGFYASQLPNTSERDGFGLKTGVVTPQFISEFVRYCWISGKLSPNRFPIVIDTQQHPTINDKYVKILQDFGKDLIEQLVQDSGIPRFREEITRYLREEKRPQLFETLANDLEPLCIQLKQYYLQQKQALDSQPVNIEAMTKQKLALLSQQLKEVGDAFRQHIAEEVSDAVNGNNPEFEADFKDLKRRMVSRLDELLRSFSVAQAHRQAVERHRRNTVVPLLAILAEAFYYLANELEDVLVDACQQLSANFFQRLQARVRQESYYLEIYRLLGKDGGILDNLRHLEKQVSHALSSEARSECDRYVRERPEFYTEGTCSVWQLSQTLQQTCRSYDYESMVEAEPAIRQLLQIDFDPKVSHTINRLFRTTIHTTLNTHLSPAAEQQAELILQQYNQARQNLEQTIEKEAKIELARNQELQEALQKKIDGYNQAVTGINGCLEVFGLDRKKLPNILESDLIMLPLVPDLTVIQEESTPEDNHE